MWLVNNVVCGYRHAAFCCISIPCVFLCVDHFSLLLSTTECLGLHSVHLLGDRTSVKVCVGRDADSWYSSRKEEGEGEGEG